VCIIDFTVDVVSVPTKDSDPAVPGLQTAATVFALGLGADGLPTGGFGTSETTISGPGLPVANPLGSTPAPITTITPQAAPRVVAQVAGQAPSLQSTPAPPPRARAAARCVVPRLKGQTLAGARHALRHAHCTVDVRRRRVSHHRGAARVGAQRPRAGNVLAAGARVTVTLDGGA
jgi:hypothetical protein